MWDKFNSKIITNRKMYIFYTIKMCKLVVNFLLLIYFIDYFKNIHPVKIKDVR